MTPKIENEVARATEQIKLEEEVAFTMVVEIFAQ